MKIALDAMGGDHAPACTVGGALEALKRFSDIEIIFVGDKVRIEQEMRDQNAWPMDRRCSIHHASQVVGMSDNATDAIRRKKDSSISRAAELLADGGADALVSAGHTGALVAAATIRLRKLPGVERPGIAAIMPTQNHFFLLLDAGANVDSDPGHLLHYGIMGSVYSREVLKVKNPRVGLLNIGSEAGAVLARDAFSSIRRRTNTEEYGGMPLLGVNGICIKAHGNSTPKAIRNAIRVAREAVAQQVNPHIMKEIAQLEGQPTAPVPAGV